MLRRELIFASILLCIFAIAAAFRVPQLDLRPLHGDEANQMVKAGTLFDEGEYRYDPHEHHGPSLYYFTLPLFWLSGAKDPADTSATLYRMVPVLFGFALLLLPWCLRNGLGRSAALWTILFAAVSHALVFYSRYYIQETLLVFFSFAAIAAGWWYLRSQKLAPALLTGLCLGLAHATKETCVILYAAMAGALLGTYLLGRWRDGGTRPIRERITGWHVAAAVVAAAAMSLLLYSSFLTYARGPIDSILALTTYLSRAEGRGSTGIHDKPWYYYLHLLLHTYRTAGPRWTEALIVVLGVIGVFVALFKRTPESEEDGGETKTSLPSTALLRFLALYALLLTAAYSLIPYKTPWNMLVLLHAMTVMAGVGAVALIRVFRGLPWRAAVTTLLLAATAHLAYQSYLGNFRYPADVRNPYVYAHTSTALMRLVRRVDEIAAFDPGGRGMHINIIIPDGDYWPLPWYLRSYTQVGYWQRFPDSPDAPFIIAAPALGKRLHEALKDEYLVEYHALRPGVLLHAYIRRDLWDEFIASRS